MITVVDYGVGNTASILNMIKHVGGDGRISDQPDEILGGSGIVLPGVGAFDHAMTRLAEGPLIETLKTAADKQIPILGICLGMQLLCDSSEEGRLPGLGLVPGKVQRFAFDKASGLKVPHMGWNVVTPTKESALLPKQEAEWRFYFVHSYYVRCAEPGDELASCQYGVPFTSAVERENVFGAQFHPEKSHSFGKKLFKNFLEIAC